MAKRLPKAARDKIESAVDHLFDKAKVRLIGPHAVPKKLYVSFNREKSLPGLYEAAHIEQRGIPDHDHLDQLLRTAENYLEAARHKAKAQTIVAVQNFMKQASKKGVETDLHTVLGGELADLYGKVTAEIHRIVDTEAQNVRNVGVIDGIVRANVGAGIEDPVVFFVVVRDRSLCDECKRLHMLPDEKTPRVWRMSELGHDYHKRGENFPKVGGLHPHCRCSMTTLMPGFGFDAAGMVVWKGEGHNELERQRHHLGKTEDLAKMALADILPGVKREDRVNWDAFNYDHLLPNGSTDGFRIEVGPNTHKTMLIARLHQKTVHGWEPVGHVDGHLAPTHLQINSSKLAAHLQGKGFGKAMYTALLVHAMKSHGVKTTGGGIHSSMASRVHQSIANEHGLVYDGQEHPGKKALPSGPHDGKFGSYDYTLKSEN